MTFETPPTPHSEYPEDKGRAQPDTYSNAWYRQQFRGVMHSLNRANAEYAGAQDQIESLEGRCERLEGQLADAAVEIGKLRDELETKLEQIREAFRELKK
jgi:chromosome segregation ATPase